MANRIHDAFDNVHAEETLKTQTQAMMHTRIRAGIKTKSFTNRRLVAALACLLLVILGGGYQLYFSPASAISIDVNPSIELGVNRFGHVVTTKAYNEDGERLLASVHLRYMAYEDAIERLMESDGMATYLNADALVSITVIGSSDQESEAMRSRIASCGYAKSANVECQCGNREMTADAHDVGLSFGKYRAFLELNALDPSITVEDVRGLTMRQIRDWIWRLSQPGQEGVSHHGNGGYGYGGGKWQ